MFEKNKLVKALLAISLATSLAACGGGSSGSDNPPQDNKAQDTSTSQPDESPKEGSPAPEESPQPETDESAQPEAEEPPQTEAPADESYKAVSSLSVFDEARFNTETDDQVMGPFTGISETGDTLVLWETSDYEIMSGRGWMSTLHYVTGNAETRTLEQVQTLPLNVNVTSIDMKMGTSGSAVIIYTTSTDVNALTLTPGSGLLSSPIQLASTDEPKIRALEVNSSGDAVLVWEETSGELVARLYDAANQSWVMDGPALNRSESGALFESEGFTTVRMNDAGEILYTDSAIKAGESSSTLITRAFNGTVWADIIDHGNPLSPSSNDPSDISADLTPDGRIAVAVGRQAPGAVFVAQGSIETGLGDFVQTYSGYDTQRLSYLDVRWTGNNQMTSTFISNNILADRHYVARSEDAGQSWPVVVKNYETVSVEDRAVTSNSENTIYIQDGAQCVSDNETFGAPLFAINHDGTIKGTCSINRMTDTSLAVNDAGQGIVAGEHDAIDAVIIHFFESGY